MRNIGSCLGVVLVGLLTMTQAVSAEGIRQTRGDPKTTYDQEEDVGHSGSGSGTTPSSSRSSEARTGQQSSSEEGHWLVRQVNASLGGRWTLYDSGEVKRVEGL